MNPPLFSIPNDLPDDLAAFASLGNSSVLKNELHDSKDAAQAIILQAQKTVEKLMRRPGWPDSLPPVGSTESNPFLMALDELIDERMKIRIREDLNEYLHPEIDAVCKSNSPNIQDDLTNVIAVWLHIPPNTALRSLWLLHKEIKARKASGYGELPEVLEKIFENGGRPLLKRELQLIICPVPNANPVDTVAYFYVFKKFSIEDDPNIIVKLEP